MEAYQLGRHALQQIQTLVRNEARKAVGSQQSTHGPFIPSQGIVIAKTGGSGIAARTGTTPGSASCTLYKINSSGVLETAKDRSGSDVTVTVYNLSAYAVEADTYIQAKQEMVSGKFLCDFEDCPPPA